MVEDSNFLDISKNNGARSLSNLSNLERNCNQIFAKGPAITKDFFDKIQNEVVPQKTDLFGYQMNTRRVILLTGLILLFTFSTMGTFTMWFTNTYEKHVSSKLVISEESPAYNFWKAPPAKPYFNIYIFNYTNVDEFESGKAKKLHVEELGPYVYFEELERVNIRFNKAAGTVSYQENRSYIFSEELSKGSKDDLLMLPNIPLLSGAALAKHQMNYIATWSFSKLLNTLSAKPFKAVKAHPFIVGYDDTLYEVLKNYLKYKDMRIFENIGLLVTKAGLQPDIFTVNTGARDSSKIGQIETFNGQLKGDLWRSDSCNDYKASDGMMFSQKLVRRKENLTFYIPQMCRKANLKFEKETTMLDKVPVNRYKVPLDIFDSDQENKCHCNVQDDVCPPRGLANGTLCTLGAPVFFSLPYFNNADPALKNAISGMEKNVTMDDTFVDIHSEYGLLLRGKAKVQVNIQLLKRFGLSQLKAYPESLMLPVAWIETGLEETELPDEIVDLIYQVTFTVKNVELGLKYGCLLATMVTLTGILLVLKKHRESRKRTDSLQQSMNVEH